MAATVAVRADVAVVKQTGWWVSASSTKNVWATLVGRSPSWPRCWHMWRRLVTAHPMGIDGQEFTPDSGPRLGGSCRGPPGGLGSPPRCRARQLVNRGVRGQEGESVDQLEAPLVQAAHARTPVTHRAASWTSCNANRGSTRRGDRWVQPHRTDPRLPIASVRGPAATSPPGCR